jgi:FlaA1/EpsC-like NDP-sugar epimerase
MSERKRIHLVYHSAALPGEPGLVPARINKVLMSPKHAEMTTVPAYHPFASNSTAGEWQSFLQRAPLTIDRADATASIGGKRILVTGAGGWIGSALAAAIAGLAPQQLVLLEASERSLYELDMAMQQLPQPTGHIALLGSVTDSSLLDEIFSRYQAPDRLSRCRF